MHWHTMYTTHYQRHKRCVHPTLVHTPWHRHTGIHSLSELQVELIVSARVQVSPRSPELFPSPPFSYLFPLLLFTPHLSWIPPVIFFSPLYPLIFFALYSHPFSEFIHNLAWPGWGHTQTLWNRVEQPKCPSFLMRDYAEMVTAETGHNAARAEIIVG